MTTQDDEQVWPEAPENPLAPFRCFPGSGQYNVYRMGTSGPEKRFGQLRLLFRVRSGKLAREIEEALNAAYYDGQRDANK